MGFFGSSHKTYYNSSSIFLFEDTPSLLEQTIKGAILENRNIADDLKTNLMYGIGYKAAALYNYGKGEYHWGLPEGTAVTYGPTLPNKIEMSIEREVNQKVYMSSASVSVNAANHMIYTATYYLLDSNSEVLTDTQYTWVYDESTGKYPYLDLELYDVQVQSQYYPIVPLRVNNVDYTDSSYTYHTDVKRACNYLGITATDIATEIANATDDDNPTEDAHLILAVNINDNTNAGMLYLHKFFEHQLGVSTSTFEDYFDWAETEIRTDSEGKTYYLTDPPVNTIRVYDSTFKLELSWLYVTQDILTGTIGNGSIGNCSRGYNSGGSKYFTQEGDRYYSTDTYWIRKQVSSTQYSEIRVHGLTFSNWAVGKELNTTISEAFDKDADVVSTFCVPLRKDLVTTLGPIKTHDLMYRSIRLVVSDKNRVKLKWYQSGIFKVAMIVIAVVIAIYNLPAGVAILSATAAVQVVVQVLLTQVILPAVVSAISDVVGQELAIIVAMVAAFYGAGGSLAEITSSVAGIVQAGISGISGLNNYLTSAKLESISDEIEDINGEIEDLLDTQVDTSQNTNFAVNVSKTDNFAIMDPTTYVTKTLREPKLPTMIGYTVNNYVDIMRYLDGPRSNINLGNRLG